MLVERWPDASLLHPFTDFSETANFSPDLPKGPDAPCRAAGEEAILVGVSRRKSMRRKSQAQSSTGWIHWVLARLA